MANLIMNDIKAFERILKIKPEPNYNFQTIIYHLEFLPELKKSAIIKNSPAPRLKPFKAQENDS